MAAVLLPAGPQDQDRGFPTTLGFKATRGFDVAALNALSALPKCPSPSDVRPAHGDDHLGWKGLLEISRNSGASGVLGAAVAPEDEQRSSGEPKGAPWLEVCCTAHTNPAIRHLVKSVIRGFKAQQEPERAADGMGGTYFFTNECGRKVAILKPCDEEPLAPNNPKGYVGRALGDPGWKPTVRVGEAAMREVAAYLLDHDGFAKVPASVLVRARHPVFCYNNRMSSVRESTFDLLVMATAGADPHSAAPLPMKLGSLQEFVSHDCDTSEMGPSRFSTSDVHRIGILDIRLFNTDRHAGNMLVRKSQQPAGSARGDSGLRVESQYELIPIDHGFCLPETLEAPYFEWLHWPQTMLPFSEEELAYIRKLNIEEDKELLRKELPNLRPECLRVMELATTVLKRGAEAGLTLYEIASILTRPFHDADEEASDLEKFCAAAMQALQVEEEEEYEIEEELSSSCESEYEVDSEEEAFVAATAGELLFSQLEISGEVNDLSAAMGMMLLAPADSNSAVADAAAQAVAATGSCKPQQGSLTSPFATCVQAAPSIGAVASSAVRPAGIAERRLHQCGDSNRDDEGMMFDLDDQEDAGHLCSKGQRNLGASPTRFSVGSSSSSAGGFSFAAFTEMSSTLDTRGSLTGGTPSQPMHGVSPSPVTPAPMTGTEPAAAYARNAARSVHVTEGFLWRHMKAQTARPAAAVSKRVRKVRKSPQAYPPPVLTCKPDSVDLSFVTLDDIKWHKFVGAVEAQVDNAIHEGRWRQSADAPGGIAMSCPR